MAWSDGLIPIDDNGNEILQSPPQQYVNGFYGLNSEDGDEYEGGAITYISIFLAATAAAYVISEITKRRVA